MLNPDLVKQAFDVAGYTITGLFGILSAWQKMRATITANAESSHPYRARNNAAVGTIERLKRVEMDLIKLRDRQDEMHFDNALQQSSMLKQQTAMFDLLLEQRSSIDKILTKMDGSI